MGNLICELIGQLLSDVFCCQKKNVSLTFFVEVSFFEDANKCKESVKKELFEILDLRRGYLQCRK